MWLLSGHLESEHIYAPSGSSNRQEREYFCNVVLTHCLQQRSSGAIVTASWKYRLYCEYELQQKEKLVTGFGLIDLWGTVPPRDVYTHYTSHELARLLSNIGHMNLRSKKVGVETMVAAFTGQPVECLRIKLETGPLRQGGNLWKMNTELLKNTKSRILFQQEWTSWILQITKYTDMVTWWEKYVRRKILLLYIQGGTARTQDDKINESFYSTSIYDTMNYRRITKEKHPL